MALESATDIGDLVPANPDGDDRIKDGDNHIRLMKQVLLNSVADTGDLLINFPNRTDAVASTNLAVGKFVRTGGKVTPGDGQGGYYEVVTAGTGTPDDLNFIDLVGSVGQLKLIIADAVATVGYQRVIATGGQTLVSGLDAFSIGQNAIAVFRNGIRQVTPTDYVETSTTSLTFQDALLNGDKVDIYTTTTVVGSFSAEDVVFVPSGDLASTDVQAALEELDTEKSAVGHTHNFLAPANNLSDVNDAATSFENIKQAATTTSAGVVEKATQSEVDAGSDNDLYVTPSTLANFSGLGGGGGETSDMAYTAGSVTISSSSTDLQTNSYTSAGGILKIEGSIIFDYLENNSYTISQPKLLLYRDATLVAKAVFTERAMNVSNGEELLSAVFFDQPAAGSYTYRIRADVGGDFYTKDAKQRGLSILEG